jgi:hypothetical protein
MKALNGIGRRSPILALCACVASLHCGPAKKTQDRFFDSNRVQIRYQVAGEGPPVVLIHGFGETLERWQSAGVVSALAPHFQVITFDVRGHGGSDKPHDRQSYGTELAADIDRLLRHLNVPKAHIVGYSMGAMVALDSRSFIRSMQNLWSWEELVGTLQRLSMSSAGRLRPLSGEGCQRETRMKQERLQLYCEACAG